MQETTPEMTTPFCTVNEKTLLRKIVKLVAIHLKLRSTVRLHTTLRTPAVVIIEIIPASCGLVLDLVSMVAPDWREVRNIPSAAQDEVLQQGIWDICQAFDASRTLRYGQSDEDYFKQQVITSAKGLMIALLIVTMVGIVVASLGIRCWEETPNLLLAGLGGILCIILTAWYASLLNTIKTSGSDIRVGYCIVLGYIGSCFMVIGGGALTVCLFQLGLHKKEKPPNRYLNRYYNDPTSSRSFINTVDKYQQPAHFPSSRVPRRSTELCDFTGRPTQVASQQTIATDFSTNQPFYADV
ncbi:claudin-23-like [Polyodon spathula]|uniref:claudin-23-like n=1 Tax=Polyodon spathula TaxID=7913 RepID=UPI001B7DB240|nr:claudin-23-like [Polyodon spathula]